MNDTRHHELRERAATCADRAWDWANKQREFAEREGARHAGPSAFEWAAVGQAHLAALQAADARLAVA